MKVEYIKYRIYSTAYNTNIGRERLFYLRAVRALSATVSAVRILALDGSPCGRLGKIEGLGTPQYFLAFNAQCHNI